MKNLFTLFLVAVCCSCATLDKTENPFKVKLMSLDPGHFHSALVQKSMYADVDSVVNLYAPEGEEVQDYLAKIEGYNNRAEDPTHWKVDQYIGEDFFEKMLEQKPGNVMNVSGKNSKKIDYILESIKAGINVYADKPLVINKEGFEKLKEAFKIAEEKNLMLYDIMTERFDVTTALQKELSMDENLFGKLVDGTLEEPAISKVSVHHFYKYVSGSPLKRPSWFFDIAEEGAGIVDVTTHLVDLVQWEAFPEQVIETSDIEMLTAKQWPTSLSKDQFTRVTQKDDFPAFLSKDIDDNGNLQVLCNGEMNYKIKGKHAQVSVVWNYEAPEGTADTHFSVMRGSKCELIIKQGAEEGFKPILYVQAVDDNTEANLTKIISEQIDQRLKGVSVEKVGVGLWKVNIPDQYKIGHEAHFAQVTENFLKYFNEGKLPAWEIPNMITKYYTTTTALEMATQK
ncbi:Putative oxidoreductase C terminal domain-containing protein [Spirosomataceae bacterium TFI 002]|nr:Putative oxidoreductase C terminal domain-containing protein [Spirosomataceae bacterium TFI 002]